MSESSPPAIEPALRTFAMPKDTNANGDIFGGWLMSQMDLAGGSLAMERAHGRVVTVAIEAMRFHLPVFVGDLVSCYAKVHRLGRTSIAVSVETWVRRHDGGAIVKVTEGVYTYVAIDENRKPRPLAAHPPEVSAGTPPER